MSAAYCKLKKQWMALPPENFDCLTFGDLKIGQKFISLPEPGDNKGHGGLREGHWIFIKTHHFITDKKCSEEYRNSHGLARRNTDDHSISDSHMPHLMPVILVE